MEVSEAITRLRELLVANHLDFECPDPKVGWMAFRDFANEPVNCADDTLNCEIGVSQRAGDERFVMVFSRRFEINDAEKFYDQLEIVRLVFETEAIEELRPYNASLSTVGYRSTNDFFVALERQPAFRALVAVGPWQCKTLAWSSKPSQTI